MHAKLIKTIDRSALQAVLEAHGKFVRREPNGRRASLAYHDLTNLALEGVELREADLTGARLSGALLRAAQLDGAILFGADLRDADLRDASLTRADLRGVCLRGAHLTNAGGRVLHHDAIGGLDPHLGCDVQEQVGRRLALRHVAGRKQIGLEKA